MVPTQLQAEHHLTGRQQSQAIPLRRLRWVTLLLVCWGIATPLVAGKYNPTLSLGDKAPSWEKLPSTDGKSYAMDDFKSADILVVVFTCNSCLYAIDYEDRIIQLAKQAAETKLVGTRLSDKAVDKDPVDKDPVDKDPVEKGAKVKVVAINVNLIKEDLLPAMKERAAKKKFNFPYLFDESQETATNYGATYTPEFFVLNKDRKVVYMGALDDNTDAKKATRNYVQEAIDATQTGKAIEVAETVAIGCRVRYKRRRRSRKSR